MQGYHLVLEGSHRRPQPFDLGPQLLIEGQRCLELLTKRNTGHTQILSATTRAVVDSHAIPRDPPPERLPPIYHLTRAQATEIIEHHVTVIREQWNASAEAARLTDAEREQMWGRQILNPAIHYTD